VLPLDMFDFGDDLAVALLADVGARDLSVVFVVGLAHD
jgi:hypothetical protein